MGTREGVGGGVFVWGVWWACGGGGGQLLWISTTDDYTQ